MVRACEDGGAARDAIFRKFTSLLHILIPLAKPKPLGRPTRGAVVFLCV